MNFAKTLTSIAAVCAASIATASPVVSNVTMTQPVGSRTVTITYQLTEDAIVTLDVLTNATPNASAGWEPIGGEAVCTATGPVWRKVTSADAVNGIYTIKWRPDGSWFDENGNSLNVENGCAKAVVTAWALDNPPNYMVVDISAGAQPNTQRYYPAVDFLPGAELGQRGAITNNPIYKTSMLVMRKIPAKGVTWTAGSLASETSRHQYGRENTRHVTLSSNYYMAVFETTQAQWGLIQTARPTPSYFSNGAYRDYRPVENVCYNEIRMQANNTGANVNSEEWPGRPYPGSFLALLSDKTGIDFDLPTEAQWEFAARAGHGSPTGATVRTSGARTTTEISTCWAVTPSTADGLTAAATSRKGLRPLLRMPTRRAAPPGSAPTSRTPGDFTTCTAMCLNGASTGSGTFSRRKTAMSMTAPARPFPSNTTPRITSAPYAEARSAEPTGERREITSVALATADPPGASIEARVPAKTSSASAWSARRILRTRGRHGNRRSLRSLRAERGDGVPASPRRNGGG
jgi:hypothetical protein